MSSTPKTLMEAIRHFSDPDVCVNFVASLRWPNGPVCPKCGGTEHGYVKTRRLWNCKACKGRFSVKMGTIFEDSPLGLDKWLCAIWLDANCKNGVSSYEVHRSLGVTQKTAWFMLHRVRLALRSGSIEKMEGHLEVDETYVGGKGINRHRGDPKNAPGTAGKTAVVGAVQRQGRAVAAVIARPDTRTLDSFVHAVALPQAVVSTDEHSGYRHLGRTFDHGVVRHSAGEYVKGAHHTNSIEGFWALLKRSIKGTYISVEPFHLGRYVDEHVFRYNHRHGSDADRFTAAVSGVSGRRLTYAALTGAR